MNQHHKQHHGFTLVEVMVYLAIFMFISVGSVVFFLSLQGFFAQYQAKQDLFLGSTAIMERVLVEVREADTVVAVDSALATSTGALALMSNATNTILIAYEDGAVVLTDATGARTTLGTDTVTVTDFVVYHYQSGASELVRVQLGLTSQQPGYSESYELTGAAVVRGSYTYANE